MAKQQPKQSTEVDVFEAATKIAAILAGVEENERERACRFAWESLEKGQSGTVVERRWST